MKLEVLLSVMNYKFKDLDKHNITCDCTVINQCDNNSFKKYKNFKIYNYNEHGLSKSRNRGLEHITNDIVLLCDDDVIYNSDYENIILNEFKNNAKADVIVFNIESPYRTYKMNTKSKRLYFYNILRYTSTRIAFKKNKVQNIKFNEKFGSGAKYSSGEDSVFLIDCLKKGLKVYSSERYIAKVYQKESKWFNGYNKKYFFDKGAVYTEISKPFRHLLFIQHLIRHHSELSDLSFGQAYKEMCNGAKDYLK